MQLIVNYLFARIVIMVIRNAMFRGLAAILLLLVAALGFQQSTHGQDAGASVVLSVGGSVTHPLELTLAELKKMPHKTVTVLNPHSNKSEVYEGVLLQDLLGKASVPQGHELRGPAMATYVLAEASDGYRVVFALAELDSDFQDSDVIVADKQDGAALGANQGPLKLVAPHDKRPARWIRMLKSLTVVTVASNSNAPTAH